MTNSQRHLSGKKREDGNYTEDSSVYANAEEATNGAGIASNRHDMNFDQIDQLSDDEGDV